MVVVVMTKGQSRKSNYASLQISLRFRGNQNTDQTQADLHGIIPGLLTRETRQAGTGVKYTREG